MLCCRQCRRGLCYAKDSIETPWSWVVLSAGFGVYLLTSVAFTPAVYYLTFYEVFGSSKSVTSWIGSITICCFMTLGPVSSMLTSRFGCRVVMITGILSASLGLILTMFATSIYHTYATYGFLMGMGLGFVFTPTTAMVTLYFDKHRTLAIGLATVGIGVGLLVYPPVCRALIHHYGWRGSLLMLGGLFLHALPLSLLIRPIDRSKKNTGHVKQEKWNIKVFKVKKYVFLCFGYFFVSSCVSTVYFFLPSYAASLGVDTDRASLLLSAMGGTSIAGRVFFSFFGQLKKVNVVVVFSVTFAIAGTFTLMSPLYTSFTSLAIFGPAFAFCVTPLTGYMTDQVIAAVGVEQLISGIGFILLFGGVGNVVAPPLAGLIVDVTGEYKYSFLFVGGVDMVGAAFLVATWPRWYKKGASKEESRSNPPVGDGEEDQEGKMLSVVEEEEVRNTGSEAEPIASSNV